MDKAEYNKWHHLMVRLSDEMIISTGEETIFLLIEDEPFKAIDEMRQDIHEGIEDIVFSFGNHVDTTQEMLAQFKGKTDYGRDALNIAVEDCFETHEVAWGMTVEEVLQNMYRLFEFDHTFFVVQVVSRSFGATRVSTNVYHLPEALGHVLSGAHTRGYQS